MLGDGHALSRLCHSPPNPEIWDPSPGLSGSDTCGVSSSALFTPSCSHKALPTSAHVCTSPPPLAQGWLWLVYYAQPKGRSVLHLVAQPACSPGPMLPLGLPLAFLGFADHSPLPDAAGPHQLFPRHLQAQQSLNRGRAECKNGSSSLSPRGTHCRLRQAVRRSPWPGDSACWPTGVSQGAHWALLPPGGQCTSCSLRQETQKTKHTSLFGDCQDSSSPGPKGAARRSCQMQGGNAAAFRKPPRGLRALCWPRGGEGVLSRSLKRPPHPSQGDSYLALLARRSLKDLP